MNSRSIALCIATVLVGTSAANSNALAGPRPAAVTDQQRAQALATQPDRHDQPAGDADRYAAREPAAAEQREFQGGRTVLVLSTTAAIVVVVILILLLT